MSAVTQLINVKYTDLTNYTEGAGNDILGVPFEHHWGPVGVLNVLSQPAFFQLYPESLPIGKSSLDPQRYYAYAQAKKCLELPNNLVEAYRVQGGWKYAEINLLKTIATPEQGQPTVYFTTAEAATQFASIANMAAVISLKYPGIPPKSLLGDYDRLAIVLSVNKDTQVFNISVCGATQVQSQPATGLYIKEGTGQTEKFFAVDEDAPVETFEGGTDPNQLVDGKSFFIEDVTAASEFIAVKVSTENPVPENITKTAIHLLSICTVPASAPETQDWEDALQVFDDTLISDASLLISPVATADCDTKLLAIAASRQDLQAVVGFPVATVFNKANIDTFLINLAGIRNMFGVFVAGREMTKIFGYNIQLNCTGGWAGSTFNIARQVRTNQLASAFTYGAYNGTLTETLSFDDVCELHKKGVISVFSSVQGAMIWGTRSLHPRQMSYFGKANVMRVLSKILRRVFPECLNAVHTDAAANPITTANFQTRFTSIVNEEVAQQNLISDSYAACTGDINSDAKTKGGTIFNLVLALHFIGLVEKINIHVFATDSSVTAKIV
jgi:hypothetical protein